MDNSLYIYIIGGFAVTFLLWFLLRKKKPAKESIELSEVDAVSTDSTDLLKIEDDLWSYHSEDEAPIDISSVQSVDSDKPFANLKSNSVGTVSQESNIEPASETKKTRKSKKTSSETEEQTKKRTYRKKGTQA